MTLNVHWPYPDQLVVLLSRYTLYIIGCTVVALFRIDDDDGNHSTYQTSQPKIVLCYSTMHSVLIYCPPVMEMCPPKLPSMSTHTLQETAVYVDTQSPRNFEISLRRRFAYSITLLAFESRCHTRSFATHNIHFVYVCLERTIIYQYHHLSKRLETHTADWCTTVS